MLHTYILILSALNGLLQVLQLETQLLDSEDRAITAEIAINEIETQLQEEKKRLETREQKEKENEKTITELEKQVKTILYFIL